MNERTVRDASADGERLCELDGVSVWDLDGVFVRDPERERGSDRETDVDGSPELDGVADGVRDPRVREPVGVGVKLGLGETDGEGEPSDCDGVLVRSSVSLLPLNVMLALNDGVDC